MSYPLQRARTVRTAKDYAIEFADYVATGAEQLLLAINHLAQAEQRHEEEGDGDTCPEVDRAKEHVDECMRALRNHVGQFRMRRDRALAATITADKWDAIWWAIFDWREAVQGADAGASADRVNSAIASTVQAHIHADRIARAEQAERTPDHV